MTASCREAGVLEPTTNVEVRRRILWPLSVLARLLDMDLISTASMTFPAASRVH